MSKESEKCEKCGVEPVYDDTTDHKSYHYGQIITLSKMWWTCKKCGHKWRGNDSVGIWDYVERVLDEKYPRDTILKMTQEEFIVFLDQVDKEYKKNRGD